MDNKMKIELNRDQIKYIAVFTMLLNHVANIFLQPGTFACEALKDIGYFTAPVMCWFLVEGYRYTRSVKKYAGRLLIFAVISQLPYYLAFAPESARKISYAASFGKSKLESDEVNETRRLLKRYDSISLRELSGVEIVDKLGIENSTNVLDPTLLLSGEDWRKISSRKFTKDRYILIYNLNRNPRIDAYAKELSIKTGLEVRYLSYQLHEFYKNGKMFCNRPVEDFLALIDGADYVITDSFHATAFSLNFNKEFVIVYPGKYSTRLQSILEILGLTNRVAKNERDLSIVESKIDYNRVNEILAAERKRSLLWLSNALSGVKNEDSM